MLTPTIPYGLKNDEEILFYFIYFFYSANNNRHGRKAKAGSIYQEA